MSVYRITKDKDKEKFELLEMTSFEEQGLRERSDMQRLLRDEPAVLEKGLFILSEEYSSWEDSSRRIDLLALDGEGRLVVVELKRSGSAEHDGPSGNPLCCDGCQHDVGSGGCRSSRISRVSTNR